MGRGTEISWCDNTLNLWWGCQKISRGCKFCYAEDMAKRFRYNVWGPDNPRGAIASWESNLDKWQKSLTSTSKVETVFVGSMMDIFEGSQPAIFRSGVASMDTGLIRGRFFGQVWKYPNLCFLLLTKRPDNIKSMIPAGWWGSPPPNVWFGASVCTTDEEYDIPKSLIENTPMESRRFLSIEPLLGSIDIDKGISTLKEDERGVIRINPMIDWAIVGGESGIRARKMNPKWAIEVVEQCGDAGIPVFVKQMGSVWARGNESADTKGGIPGEWIEELRIRDFPPEWL